jgi:hypothetical protein
VDPEFTTDGADGSWCRHAVRIAHPYASCKQRAASLHPRNHRGHPWPHSSHP